MLTASVDINEWNRTANRIVTRLKLDAPRFVKKEVGELVKTLVKISPPKNLAQSKKKSGASVRTMFRPVPRDPFRGKQIGKGSHRWLFATPALLVGVAAEDHNLTYDATSARRMLYKKGAPKNVMSRLGKRGKQVVELVNRRIIRKQVYNAVRKKIQDSFGRLKAGWMVGVFKGELKLTGANLPPAWVTKHRNGVRGATLNHLGVAGQPSFTIINRAKGVSSAAVREISNNALLVRAKAMAANAKLILAGKKKYAY